MLVESHILYFQNITLGMFLMTGLTILIGWFLYLYCPELKTKSILILPYLIWLTITTSLIGYILIKN
jgi:benzodiazapine receptor